MTEGTPPVTPSPEPPPKPDAAATQSWKVWRLIGRVQAVFAVTLCVGFVLVSLVFAAGLVARAWPRIGLPKHAAMSWHEWGKHVVVDGVALLKDLSNAWPALAILILGPLFYRPIVAAFARLAKLWPLEFQPQEQTDRTAGASTNQGKGAIESNPPAGGT